LSALGQIRYTVRPAGATMQLPEFAPTASADRPTLVAPGVISTEEADDLHPTFTRDGRTLYFVRRVAGGRFTIMVSRLGDDERWSEPRVAPFSGRHSGQERVTSIRPIRRRAVALALLATAAWWPQAVTARNSPESLAGAFEVEAYDPETRTYDLGGLPLRFPVAPDRFLEIVVTRRTPGPAGGEGSQGAVTGPEVVHAAAAHEGRWYIPRPGASGG
jgi:hypothetical protein